MKSSYGDLGLEEARQMLSQQEIGTAKPHPRPEWWWWLEERIGGVCLSRARSLRLWLPQAL